MKPRPSNRKIADMAKVSPATVDRLMKGQVDTRIENIDAVADILGVPRREARQLASLPATSGGPYQPPEESRLLDSRQRAALDELIRAFVASSPAAPPAPGLRVVDGEKDALDEAASGEDDAPPAEALADAARPTPADHLKGRAIDGTAPDGGA